MRGDRKGLSLRKGKVIEQISPTYYRLRDVINQQEIRMSVSSRLAMSGITLNIGQEVYIIVSVQDQTRGQLAVPGHRGGLEDFQKEKELLDAGKDPMTLDEG